MYLSIPRVKLAVNNETQEAVAVKIINLERNPQASECVRKEVIQALTQAPPWGRHGKNIKKSSSPKPQGRELSYFVCSNV